MLVAPQGKHFEHNTSRVRENIVWEGLWNEASMTSQLLCNVILLFIDNNSLSLSGIQTKFLYVKSVF